LPGSQLDKACDYALRIWPRLEVFLTHGQVELDTNLAENAMRPVALGRKKLAAHRRRKSRPQNRGRPERAGHLPAAGHSSAGVFNGRVAQTKRDKHRRSQTPAPASLAARPSAARHPG